MADQEPGEATSAAVDNKQTEDNAETTAENTEKPTGNEAEQEQEQTTQDNETEKPASPTAGAADAPKEAELIADQEKTDVESEPQNKTATPPPTTTGDDSVTQPDTQQEETTTEAATEEQNRAATPPKAEEQEVTVTEQAQEPPAEAPKSPEQQPEENNIPAPPPPMTGLETRSETLSSVEEKTPATALSMQWSFGMNRNNPVINLTDEHRKMIAYTCAHTGVLYDFANNKQYLLQGHANSISCMCVSGDKRWLATADKGDDSLLIVWDTYTGIPVRTIFEPHPDGGCSAIALTPDAKFLATISGGETQTIAIWNWTSEGDQPICTATLRPQYGEQNFILFNPDDVSQLVTNSESRVIFYNWKSGKIDYFAPPLTDDDFNKQVGKYSQSIFVAGTRRALTATSVGNLVVWDTNKATKMGERNIADKRAVKLVKLQDRGLNVITTTDTHIVTGDVLGHVKFFDYTLKLTNWYQDFHLGPINSLSFAYFPEFNNPFDPVQGNFPADATIKARQFVIRDFVVGTSNAVYANVTTDGTDVKVIHRDHDAAVYGLSAHPTENLLAVGSYSGLLKVWNYENKTVEASRRFDKGMMIRCCQYDPRGQFIAVGFTNGMVKILDGVSLEDLHPSPFRFARDAITHIAFSHNSRYLAVADAEHTMSLFIRHVSSEEGNSPYKYVGRYRAHYKLIVDIMFGVQLDSNEPRLLSLGEDRHLVEYDLENSSEDDLRILSSDRIEQSAVPMCMAWYPPVTKESFIVTANDQFKYKLYNATTKMCRKTLLAPTYNSPMQKMVVLPCDDPVNDARHVAYITVDKIGLNGLPLDGNPHNTMALVAHPQGVVNLVSSRDGKYLFSAGGVDATVHMWDINLQALQAQSKLGGDGLVPFYGLMDGSREGELFKELEDYFYYAQLRSQGINTTEARKVTTTMPVSEIPFVMRALGFYPSEQEIEDMLNEVKYSTYVESGEYKTEVDMEDFIRLYVNHRPAFGLQPEKLQWAFDILGEKEGSELTSSVYRGELLDLLQNRGEHMTEYELAEYLTTLLGFNEEGGSSELQPFDPSEAGDLIDQNLPHKVSGEMFANELLGFGMYSDVLQIEQDEAMAQ